MSGMQQFELLTKQGLDAITVAIEARVSADRLMAEQAAIQANDSAALAEQAQDRAAASASTAGEEASIASAQASLAQIERQEAQTARIQAEAVAAAAANAAQFYDTIALGRAAVVDGQSFGVRAGGSDGLVRPTVYRRDGASSQTALLTLLPASEFESASNVGQNFSLITDSSSTSTAYVASVRAAQNALTIGNNSILTFAPNTTSGESPTLTVNGVTRTIRDTTGGTLPAGALVAGGSYALRVFSSSDIRLHAQLLTATRAKDFNDLLGSYRIRNSAAVESRPGDNPALFARSFTGGPDAAPPMDLPIVDIGADGGRVVQFTNNSISLRERLPVNGGQRYRFLFRFRVTTDSAGTAANVTLLVRCMNDTFTGISTLPVWSEKVTVTQGWQVVEIDTANISLSAGTTVITPVIRHNLTDGVLQVQIIERMRVTATGGGGAGYDDTEIRGEVAQAQATATDALAKTWEPQIRPNAVMQVHNDYPTYRNWVTPPYAPIVLSGSTGFYPFAWPHPRVCIQADSGRKMDLTHMVRGTSFRYIVRTGTGGVFAGFGGRTFFGQGGANYVTCPAGTIVDVAFDASSAHSFLTVTPVVGNVTYSTIADPVADKTILYAGQSLSAQAYQMGGPGGFYHAQQSGWGGVTPIRDVVRFIQGAEGGTTVDKRGNTTRYWWDRDTDAPGPVLLDCVAAVNAAITAGQPRPVAVFWNQGQSDATYISGGTYGYADYLAQLIKVLDYLQANALDNAGKFICTTISRADRTNHSLGANAVRQAQLEVIAARADCFQGPEQYDLSGEGGLDVHLSPKGYFTSDYRMFRAWHNAMFGTTLSQGPRVNTVTRTDDRTVVITLTDASRLPIGRGKKGGANVDFGPTPFLFGAIPSGQNGGQGLIEFEEGTLVGSTLTLKAKSSLVGARIIYPSGYVNGWRDAVHPTDSESHLDYDGQPLRSYISGPI